MVAKTTILGGEAEPTIVRGDSSKRTFISGSGFIKTPASAPTGTWASTETADHFSGTSAPAGVWGSTETPDAFAGVGHPSLFGAWASTEAKDTWASTFGAGFPDYVNAGTRSTAGSGTSLNIALPASLVVGNTILAMIGCLSTGGKTYTWPAGWNVIDTFSDSNISGSWAYRTVDGTETTPNVTWSGSASAVGKAWQFHGVVTIGAFNHTGDTGNNSTYTNAALTTTAANSRVFNMWIGNNGTVSGTPTAYTLATNESNIAGFYQDVSTLGAHSTAISQALSGNMRWISAEVELTSVIPPNFAAWSSTEVKDVWASFGSLIGGSWHSTEAKDFLAFAGYVASVGILSVTEGKDIFAGSVFVPPFGPWGSVETPDVFGFSGQPTPALGVDAHAQGGNHVVSGGGITTANVTIASTVTNTVIVLGIVSGGFFTQGAVASITDTAGLTWKRRLTRRIITPHQNGTDDSFFEEWWAHKPTVGSTTITVTTDPTGAICIDAFAVSGANYAAPFDTHTGSGWLADNFGGTFIDASGLGHVGNPYAFIYTDVPKVLTLAWHGGLDAQPDGTVAPGFTYTAKHTEAEHVGLTGHIASCYRVFSEQEFGLIDVWFGPDGSRISNRALLLDNIVGADEAGTNDVIRWFFDGFGSHSTEQMATGQNTTSKAFRTYRENDIAVVAVLTQGAQGGRVSTITDDGNHSGWTLRSSVIAGANILETWWVEMPEPFNGTVTVVMDANTQPGDIVSTIMFAVNGPSVFQRGEIWDGDVSLPATNFGTSGFQTVGPFDSLNENVLVMAIGANVSTTDVAGDLTNHNTLPYLFLPTELTSVGPPTFNIGLQFKFSGPPVADAIAEFDLSPAAQSWLMIADVMPVGPVTPPQGAWISQEVRDRMTNPGGFQAIGIDTVGWVGYVPAHASIAVTEPIDITTNDGSHSALWDFHGWLGFVPAFLSLAATDAKDVAAMHGWKLGAESILGRFEVTEVVDRFAGGNRPTVTGTLHSTEVRDRFAGNGLIIPTAAPTPPRRRQLLIVT